MKQVELILKEIRSMPLDYRSATDKARLAAARNRKPTWSLFSLSYINALLIGLRKLKFGNQTYEIIILMNATENYAYGILAQACLTYEDFNLAIGPIAAVLAPELFVEEQGWNLEPIIASAYAIPYRPPSYRSSRRKAKTTEDNLIEFVDNLVREAVAQATPSPVVSVRPIDSSTDDRATLDIMLAAGKNP